MHVGDLVVLPLKQVGRLAFGVITGEYKYLPGTNVLDHVRASHKPRSMLSVSGSQSGISFPSIAYGASKAAVSMVTVQYAKAHPAVKFNAVEPGITATDLGGPGHYGRSAAESAKIVARLAEIGPDGPTGMFWEDDGELWGGERRAVAPGGGRAHRSTSLAQRTVERGGQCASPATSAHRTARPGQCSPRSYGPGIHHRYPTPRNRLRAYRADHRVRTGATEEVPMSMRLRDVPTRLVTGAYILHSGITKLKAGPEQAAGLHGAAATAYPLLNKMPADRFVRSLAIGEITVGSLLLLPFIPNVLAGAVLTVFSSGLVGMYLRTPALRKPGSIWPSQAGTAISKDAWMLGIGLGILVGVAEDSSQ